MPTIIGHETIRNRLISQARAQRLPTGFLFQGVTGIGKSILAKEFGFWLLRGGHESDSIPFPIPKNDPVRIRATAGGHGDFLLVEKGLNEMGKPTRDIPVDSVRKIIQFMRQTPLEGGWRVVIINPVDDLNRNGANALLKVLEEPPQKAILLLVCHSLGKILPTIRSRVQMIKMNPLAEESMVSYVAHNYPQVTQADQHKLVQLSDGRPGFVNDLMELKGLEAYKDWLETLRSVLSHKPKLSEFVTRYTVTSEPSNDPYANLTPLILRFNARLVNWGVYQDERAILPEEKPIFTELLKRRPLDHWAKVWENMTRIFTQADRFSLDRKQVLFEACSVYTQLR